MFNRVGLFLVVILLIFIRDILHACRSIGTVFETDHLISDGVPCPVLLLSAIQYDLQLLIQGLPAQLSTIIRRDHKLASPNRINIQLGCCTLDLLVDCLDCGATLENVQVVADVP